MLPENNTAARILVVDDNPAIHEDFRLALGPELMNRALEADDRLMFGEPAQPRPVRPAYELEHALSGPEGIEKVRQSLADDRPYLVAFVDIRMPGMDGVATIEGIWRLDPSVQVVICTAYSDYSWDELRARLGHTDKLLVLKKPFDDIEVTQCASTLAEKWFLGKQAALKLEQMELLVAQRTQRLLDLQRREWLKGTEPVVAEVGAGRKEGEPFPAPLVEPPPVAGEPSDVVPAEEAAADGEGPLVLVVGDADLADQIGHGLGAQYRLVKARTGSEALTQARDAVPDGILLDMDLAGLEGLEVCRILKQDELVSHVPVILAAAKTQEAFQIKALEAGADDYLAKPLHLPLLKARLDNLLESRRKLLDRFTAEAAFQPRDLATNQGDAHFLRRVGAVVERNLSDFEFDVPALAAQLRISRRQLFRKLKAVAGCTPNSYIRTMRLQRAAYLLENSEMTVTNITYAVGFADLKYFRNLFKEQYGVLPGDYAKQAGRDEGEG